MIHSRRFFLGSSPLGLLSLSACNSTTTTSGGENNLILDGHAVLGPLQSGVAFVDYNGSGTLDLASEPYVYTNSDGSFSLPSTQGLKKVIVTTNSVTAGGLPINAIDGSSSTLLSGVTITGPSGSSVLSPASTLLEQSSSTEAEVAKALGLEGISLTEFNPYAAGVDADNALAFEKVATQVITAVKAISAAAQGSGATAEASSNAAFESVVQVVKAKAAAGEALDLSDDSDLEAIQRKAATDLAKVSGVDTTAFNAILETAITAVGTVNRQVKLITDTDLSSSATKGLFATADYLAKEVKAAAQAELSSPGTGVGSITLVNEANVKSMASDAASNSAPTNLLASTRSFDENSTASIAFTGVDEPKTSFKFGLSGNDASSFTLNSSTGVLTLSSDADFEEKSSYTVVVTVTDDATIPLSYSKEFTFTVNDVIENGEVYESSNAGNTIFLIVDGATSGKFDVIPVKVKDSGYEFDASKKTETAYDVAADKLADSIGREPTKKADASNSDLSAAKAAAETALTPSVTITAFNNASSTRDEYAVADGATSNDGKLYLKFTLSDSSTDFVVDDITVTGGTLSNFTGSRTEYTAELTPTGSSKVDTTLNVTSDKFTNDYFGNTAATEFNWTYDPSSGAPKAGEVYESSNAGNTIFLIVDGATSGKFDVIPVKVKDSGYEFDASKKTETAYDVAADKLADSIGREPTKKADASNSDLSAAKAAAETALTPSVTITAFNNASSTRDEYAVADGATSNDGKLYLKFTLSDSSTDFVVDDITVTGGTLSNFTGSRTEYTAELTPTGSSKVDTTLNVTSDKFTNDYFGNTAATEFNWTYDPSSGAPKAGEVYESGSNTFLLVDGATSGKFDVIPVKVKSGGSGYEFDASKKTETAYDVAADKLADSIGREPTKKADASNSDLSAAKAAAETALTPSVTITAFNNASSTRDEYAVADGATSNDGKLYLKFTLSDSSTDFVVDDITVTGGTLSNFTGSRTEYTAEFTPTGSSKVDTTLNVTSDKFTNDYFGNTAATEFNWTYDPSSGAPKAGEVYESGSNTFLLVDGATSGKFDVIPVKVKSGGSGYEFDASKKTETAYDVAADKLADSIGREPTKKADASNSDLSAAKAAAETALTPSVAITAFSDSRYSTAVADGATSKDGKLYLKFTLSDSSTDFVVGDITVTGGTLSNFTGSRTEYTAEFTPTGSSKVDTTLNVTSDKFTNDYFGNTAATEFNWTYDPSSGAPKAGEVYESGSNTFLLVDGATSGKFDVIPVKVKSGGSGYEFDASKKTETAYDVAADKLADSIGREPTKKADASNSDLSAAKAAAETALTPSVAITAFSDSRYSTAVADGATSKDGKLYLKFTLSDSSTDFVVGDITVTGGTLSNFTGSRTEYTAEFTPTGSSKVDTTLNVTSDKFTNDYFGNTAATEFNWTYDPDNGLKDGDVIKEVDSDGNPTGKFLLLDIDSGKYSLAPVKDNGSGTYIFEGANASSGVIKASSLSASEIVREIGTSPTGNGDTISSSDATPILKQAGITAPVHGDIVKAIDGSGDPTDRLLLLNIESTKHSLIPVKKDGGGAWVYDNANSGEKVTGGSGLSDTSLTREIGSTPFGAGESISDSDAFPVLISAGVIVSLYGDEKGGTKAFTAGAYDASDDLASPNSDGIGWILKSVKSFGETTTAKGEARGVDLDYFQLIDSHSSSKLTGSEEYKITVADEVWNGSDSGDIARVLVKDQDGNNVSLTNSGNDYTFTADGSSDYFLEIMGEAGEDAQYSMIFDIV